jgi:putative transposase
MIYMNIAKPRRVQQDGIQFQGLRYLDVNLAAYVGEEVTIRYDPQDMAEIRVYHQNQFVCRAVCQDLAAQQISLKEIVAARTQRRQQVRDQLQAHQTVISALLPDAAAAASGAAPLEQPGSAAPPAAEEADRPRLKRYVND